MGKTRGLVGGYNGLLNLYAEQLEGLCGDGGIETHGCAAGGELTNSAVLGADALGTRGHVLCIVVGAVEADDVDGGNKILELEPVDVDRCAGWFLQSVDNLHDDFILLIIDDG